VAARGARSRRCAVKAAVLLRPICVLWCWTRRKRPRWQQRQRVRHVRALERECLNAPPAHRLGRARRGQAFTGEAVRSYAGLIDGVVQRYCARWDAGGEFQAYHVCKDLAFDVAACVLLGMQLDVRRP